MLPLVLLAGCGGGSSGQAPTPDPTQGSAAYPALEIGDVPGELVGSANDEDADRTDATLVATVPAGKALGVRAVCRGTTTMTITTTPDTAAATTFACGIDLPEQRIAEAVGPVAATTSYAITVSVPAPARWALVVYAAGG